MLTIIQKISIGQGLFNAGEDVKEVEHEFNNPGIGIAAGVDEADTGLGGMLRNSSIKQPNANLNGNAFNDLSNSAAGGKGQIKLANFLNADIFGDVLENQCFLLFHRII